MEKIEAIRKFKKYLNSYGIPYKESCDNGGRMLTMSYAADNAPNEAVEACIWFFDDDIAETRCYYTALGAKLCEKSEHRGELLRLLNYINARVYLSCAAPDGLYEPHMLYTPRFYLTEDDHFDITMTTIGNYDFWETTPVETNDYLTKYCPELMNQLAFPVFGVLLGKITMEEAITHINRTLLSEKEG